MARRRGLRSISVPITMGAIAVPLSAALLVGWTVLFGQKIAEQQEIFVEVWLLVLGAISFTVIIGVLVLLSYFLAREILELHTLGVRSGYTQDDVKEFARALTGWTLPGDGGTTGGPPGGTTFRFVPALH